MDIKYKYIEVKAGLSIEHSNFYWYMVDDDIPLLDIRNDIEYRSGLKIYKIIEIKPDTDMYGVRVDNGDYYDVMPCITINGLPHQLQGFYISEKHI